MSFKLRAVQEIESGELSKRAARRKYGILKHEFLLDKYNARLSVTNEMVKSSIRIYNQLRPYYSCYMRTPEQIHRQAQIRIRAYKKTNRTRVNLDTVS